MTQSRGTPLTTAKQQAQALLRQGSLHEARAVYEQLCRHHGRDAECHYALGSIHGELGEFTEAVKCYRRAVKLQPSAAIAHCGLGSALQAQGKSPEAERSFREALRLRPDLAGVQLQLAAVLLDQEKLSDAEQCLRAYLAANPRSAEALASLGEIHHARQELHEAIDFYNQALAIAPTLANAHYRLGVALHTLGAIDGAIAHYERTLQLAPDFVEAAMGLGDALKKAGRSDEAIATYDRILEREPVRVGAIVGKAEVYETDGEYGAAHSLLVPLIERGVEHSGLGITFASICRHDHRYDEGIEYLERLLANQKLNSVAEEGVCFALGKLYDAVGRYRQAFQAYQKANSFRPRRFNRDEHVAMIDRLMATFTREFLAGAPRATRRSGLPIFVVGMPRSGTSLVEQILASHPEVFGAGELPDIGNFVAELAAPRGLHYPHCFQRVTQDDIDRLTNRYLTHLATFSPESTRVVDKLPQNFQHLGFIALLCPDARIVHCQRDPLDTCLSIYFQHFYHAHKYASDLADIGAYYKQYERLMAHWKEVLGLPMFDVSYAELVANQERMSRELIEFCGLVWDERCLAFYKTKRPVTTCSYDQVRQPIYSTPLVGGAITKNFSHPFYGHSSRGVGDHASIKRQATA